jgi:hypothetical protein
VQKLFFIDPDSGRATTNGFVDSNLSALDCRSRDNPYTINTNLSATSAFECKVTVNNVNADGGVPVVLRTRMFYSSNQKFAVQPTAGNLPPQARLYTSIGTTGSEAVQRVLQIMRVDHVVPPFFDYAIFSAGEITK